MGKIYTHPLSQEKTFRSCLISLESWPHLSPHRITNPQMSFCFDSRTTWRRKWRTSESLKKRWPSWPLGVKTMIRKSCWAGYHANTMCTVFCKSTTFAILRRRCVVCSMRRIWMRKVIIRPLLICILILICIIKTNIWRNLSKLCLSRRLTCRLSLLYVGMDSQDRFLNTCKSHLAHYQIVLKKLDNKVDHK